METPSEFKVGLLFCFHYYFYHPLLVEKPAGFKYLTIAYKYLKDKKEKQGKELFSKVVKAKK